ncbi:hypothetical protein RR46_10875 [Papilio xuthus]|uniref:Uncharacterized protein n=1 Tax=Papilio xuthus TaxID=66420 RepID=A0A194PR61_PAPXU|nr:hypothetical protein RR46_10875 [Papilio xuthus]
MVRLRERHERGQDAELASLSTVAPPFNSRLRLIFLCPFQSAQPSEETEQTNNGENASVEAEETQSLVARTERRSRRSRRARRAQARQNPSINSETRGEIGVAALPVSPADATPQHMIL